MLLIIDLAIWKLYTRIHGGFGEFFPEFFDLIMSTYQNFKKNWLQEVVSGQCIYTVVHVSPFFRWQLQNQKVGCKDHAVLLFNILFMYHVFISVTPIFFLQPCPVMVDTVRSLPPEPTL